MTDHSQRSNNFVICYSTDSIEYKQKLRTLSDKYITNNAIPKLKENSERSIYESYVNINFNDFLNECKQIRIDNPDIHDVLRSMIKIWIINNPGHKSLRFDIYIGSTLIGIKFWF